MRRSATEFTSAISRALITVSNQMLPSRPWSSSLDQTLHRLGCRDSLSPSLVAQVIDPFLLRHHSLAFGFFNWASQQPGFSHTSVTYESILKSLSISCQFNSIDKILKQIRVQKNFIDPSVSRSVVGSLVVTTKIYLAYSVFCDVGSVIGPECAVRRIDFSGIDGSIIAFFVIHGLCAEARANEAIWALEALRENGCKPDFMAYRIIAETSREMGNVEMILKRKRKFGVAPRTNYYRKFIYQLVKERLICEAKELGEIIITGNFPIEDDVLNVLIGSVAAIDPLLATSFLKFMLDKERLPTLLTLINLSENLCKNEKTDELVEIFELLSTK